MAVIELVEALTVQQQAVGEAEAATKRTAKDGSAKTAHRGAAAKKSTKDEGRQSRGQGRGAKAEETEAEGEEPAAEESKDA